MAGPTTIEQDDFISQAVEKNESRLRNFIRRSVPDRGDAEDILQDVFYELVEAYRMMKPIEHVTAWLFRVTRNRIIDMFRGRRTESLSTPVGESEDGGGTLEDLLSSADAGPEAEYARAMLMDALDEALDELPASQREVFVAHELMGKSFKEIAEETGVGVNTLLSRKRYAVLQLRERLQAVYEDL